MRPRLPWKCGHTDRPYRALGLCRACYLKQNGGSKRWYVRHRTKMIRNVAEWVKKNRVRRRKNAREWARRTYDKNRIVMVLRARIGTALRHLKKSDSTQKLVGCSLSDLRVHLEAQFLPGMSWKNHGRYGWHVDHKRPCVSFDLSKPSQQRQCFNFTNLQPLWWRDNLSKGATRR